MTLRKDYYGRGISNHPPRDKLDYSVEWAGVLSPGQTITNSYWELDDPTYATLSDSELLDDTIGSVVLTLAPDTPIGTQKLLTNWVTIERTGEPSYLESRTIRIQCSRN